MTGIGQAGQQGPLPDPFDAIIESIQAHHRDHPELRFGQIVDNGRHFTGITSLFYIHDNDLLVGLETLRDIYGGNDR